MREQLLRDFFTGEASVAEIAHDLQGAIVHTGLQSHAHIIEAMDTPFLVQPEHLVRLCDAVLDGSLPAEGLEAIGFCLIGSDCFEWDTDSIGGGRVSEVALLWAEPVVNYPLNRRTVQKFRYLLASGENTFTEADLSPTG